MGKPVACHDSAVDHHGISGDASQALLDNAAAGAIYDDGVRVVPVRVIYGIRTARSHIQYHRGSLHGGSCRVVLRMAEKVSRHSHTSRRKAIAQRFLLVAPGDSCLGGVIGNGTALYVARYFHHIPITHTYIAFSTLLKRSGAVGSESLRYAYSCG